MNHFDSFLSLYPKGEVKPLQLASLLATRALTHRITELRVLVLRLHLMIHLHDLLVPI